MEGGGPSSQLPVAAEVMTPPLALLKLVVEPPQEPVTEISLVPVEALVPALMLQIAASTSDSTSAFLSSEVYQGLGDVVVQLAQLA